MTLSQPCCSGGALALHVNSATSSLALTRRGRDSPSQSRHRPYTPVSDISQRGTVDFLIKVYPEGRMSQALDALAVGDKVLFKGPKGRFVYKPDTWNAIGMLAGGTGITPMYQLLQKILKDPNDTTEVQAGQRGGGRRLARQGGRVAPPARIHGWRGEVVQGPHAKVRTQRLHPSTCHPNFLHTQWADLADLWKCHRG